MQEQSKISALTGSLPQSCVKWARLGQPRMGQQPVELTQERVSGALRSEKSL